MIWLVGNKGMLGTDVEKILKTRELPYTASDIEVDITDKLQLEDFIAGRNINLIINCSAYTAVDKAEDEPDTALRINRDGVRNLAEICRDNDMDLIHISTDYVFDGSKKGAYLEDDPVNPAGAYGKSKADGEYEVQQCMENYFILRTAWLYGKNGGNFVYTMLRLFKEKGEVSVIYNQEGSPTYSKDLAEAVVHIAESKANNKYGIYNFSNEGKTSWYEFAKQILVFAEERGLIKKEVKINPITEDKFPMKAKRPANSYLSKEKIKNNFNLKIRNWQDALKEFIKEIKE